MEAPISETPQYIHMVTWGFYGMISLIGWLALARLTQLSESVALLNERVAVVIARVDTHEKRLDKHEDMIDEIERKQ